jgi:hypothetical protein
MVLKLVLVFTFTSYYLVVIMIFRESGDIYGSIRANHQASQRPVSTGLWPGIDTPGLIGVSRFNAFLKMFSYVDFTPNNIVGTSPEG